MWKRGRLGGYSFRLFGFRILSANRRIEFRISGHAGYTPSLQFRQPQLVPSDSGGHVVLESSVFPPASSGRQKNQSKFSAGYTAIEVVIVASIMMVISAIVLVGFGGLNDSVALNRSVRDLAVVLRRAQNMALAVTGVPAIGNVVPPAVGVELTKGASTYLLFADRVGSRDNKYGSSDGELIQSSRFDRNVVAYQFFDVSGDIINPAGGVLNIIFSAPEADLRITDGNGNGDSDWAKVDIVFRSPSGKEKVITVRESGQITVR